MMSDREQEIQDSKNKDFGQVPHYVVDQGILKILKGSEAKVYMALIRHADYLTGVSFPTVDSLIAETGCGDCVIAQATNRLAALKLIEKKRTGKRFGFRNTYKIIRDPNIDRCITPSKTGKSINGLRGENGRFVVKQCITPSNTGECNSNALPRQTRVNAGAGSDVFQETFEQAPPNLTGYCSPSNTGKCIHSAKTGKKERHIETLNIETEEEQSSLSSVVESGRDIVPVDSKGNEGLEITDAVEGQPLRPSRRAPVPAQEVGSHFAELYESMTRQPFKHSKKDFCIIARLLKEFGPEAVINKINVLAAYCQRGEVWFAKQGVADFTIGNLSAQWNRLILQVRLTPEEIKQQEFQEALKKERERAERFNE